MTTTSSPRVPVAIVGMGAMYAGARNATEFWENCRHGRLQVGAIPANRFEISRYYHLEKNTEKTYTQIGAFIPEIESFPYSAFDIPAEDLDALDLAHKVALLCTQEALAGMTSTLSQAQRGRTAIILGNSGLWEMQDLALLMRSRAYGEALDHALRGLGLSDPDRRQITAELDEGIQSRVRRWHGATAAAGTMPFAIPARIAQAWKLQGPAMVLDAACASSLAAIESAVDHLSTGLADVAISGGVDLLADPVTYLGFSALGGLSPDGARPFDQHANGLVLGEGAGIVVLKRLDDAVRDGDQVHAVIRGIGASSDGGRKAIYAPDDTGVGRALRQGLDEAGWQPDDVQYLEAHATSTPVGDATEYNALAEVYGAARRANNPLRVGSIKEAIGHTKAAAGVANIIKVAKAMAHELMPPQATFTGVNQKVKAASDGIEISAKGTPWPALADGSRKAACSGSGFGGINYHILLESRPAADWAKISAPIELKPASEPLAIVAMSCLFPTGIDSTGALASQLQDPKASLFQHDGERWVGQLPDFPLNPVKIKTPPNAISQIDPGQMLAVKLTSDLLEQLPGVFDRFDRSRIGVVLGTMFNEHYIDVTERARMVEYEAVLENSPTFAKLSESQRQAAIAEAKAQRLKDLPALTEHTLPGWMPNVMAGRITKVFNVSGPNLIVDASEVSGIAAMRIAMDHLRTGRVDMVIAGAVNAATGPEFGKITGAMPSPSTRHPYDSDRGGAPLSAGGALFAVRRLRDAKADGDTILGVVHGASTFVAASEASLTHVDDRGMKQAIELCLPQVEANQRAFDMIEVSDLHDHGKPSSRWNGNLTDDASLIPRGNQVPAVSVSTLQLGNMRGATAMGSTVVALSALQHGKLPHSAASLNSNWRGERALVAATGMFGAHGALALARPDASPIQVVKPAVPVTSTIKAVPVPAMDMAGIQLWFAAADSQDELLKIVRSHVDSLASKQALPAAAGSGTFRLAATFSSPDDLLKKLKSSLSLLEQARDVSVLRARGIFWSQPRAHHVSESAAAR